MEALLRVARLKETAMIGLTVYATAYLTGR
jgi:hypothetical protein